jgi:hypothetical protein
MRGHVTHIICIVEDYIGLYNKVVHPVICEDGELLYYKDRYNLEHYI